MAKKIPESYKGYLRKEVEKLEVKAIEKIISEKPLPIFAHQEITDYKPKAPLNLKRRLEIKKPPLAVVIRLIQILLKLGIITRD